MANWNLWLMILLVAFAIAILMANAIYLTKVNKALKENPDLDIAISQKSAKSFVIIDWILTSLFIVGLAVLLYEAFKPKNSGDKHGNKHGHTTTVEKSTVSSTSNNPFNADVANLGVHL
jgi:hypothetical protein